MTKDENRGTKITHNLRELHYDFIMQRNTLCVALALCCCYC